jgi:hypothetical protein
VFYKISKPCLNSCDSSYRRNLGRPGVWRIASLP